MTSIVEQRLNEQEDGEIIEDEEEDSSPIVLSSKLEIEPAVSKKLLNYSSSDDEPPEEVLNSFIKKVVESKKLLENEPVKEVDPSLCKVCFKNPHKYRCPKCNLRSCSLDCSKQHKTTNNCDGIRQPFTSVEKLSQYDAEKSIDDQKFMQKVKENAGLGAEVSTSTHEVSQSDGESDKTISGESNSLRFSAKSTTEKFLLNAARFRHIWLGFTNDSSPNESRHEQFSDTIFWTLQLVFRRQLSEENKYEEFTKTVNNIPETIRVCTVLKQFFKPRKFGCIVSETDLDLKKMEKFIEKGMENVNIYMEVHNEKDKYYGILGENTILENTRNRVVANYPKFIITLNDEFTDMKLLTTEELEKVSEKYGGISNGNDRFAGNRRGGGRGRGFHRGNGGGGNGFGRKRNAQNGGYDNNWKRGRGGHNGGQKRNFHHNRNELNQLDSFDPFEPFAGPTRLPMEYGISEKN